MAAIEAIPSDRHSTTSNPSSLQMIGDGSKSNPLDSLMEKLRVKANHYKQWADMSKALRMAVMDKRHVMDNVERNQLQKCLDTIQKSIKVTSLQSMVERLESITRQQGLKFTAGPSGMDCFISSDMFYVEVLLENTGEVKDVKIAHHGDPVSCPELSKVLRQGNFGEFTSHLEGLSAIYQLNADKKQKTKAYLALQALETDLSTLAQVQQSYANDPSNLVHKSPVGILQPRQGGHPMKLTYFISPYDLLDSETETSIPFTVDAITERKLGHSVTVCIESSTAHRLQINSLSSLSKKSEGKSLPSFAAFSNLNSTTLPASFMLRLSSPIPMANSVIDKIQSLTGIECADMSTSQSLLSLITKESSKGKLQYSSNHGLFVTLPDQHHCYYLSSSTDLQGVLVSGVPFTHPTHVPQILVFLRQQVLFNTVIGSCIRPASKTDVDSPLMFEVSVLTTTHLSISFEHPLEESLATVDLDLRDITNVKCKIFTLTNDTPLCTDEYTSKVMQRCLSIPVTMRAVLRKAHVQRQQARASAQGDFFYGPVPGEPGLPYFSQLPGYGAGNSLGSNSSFGAGDFSNLTNKMSGNVVDRMIENANNQSDTGKPKDAIQNTSAKQYPLSSSVSPSGETSMGFSPASHMQMGGSQAMNTASDQDFFPFGHEQGMTSDSNPMSRNLIAPGLPSTTQAYQQQGRSNAMLMNMLSDVPAANSLATSFPFLSQTTTTVKPRKQRKRKTTSELRSPGRSGGKRASEDDSRDLPTPDSESTETSMSFEHNFHLSTSFTEQQYVRPPSTQGNFVKGETSPAYPVLADEGINFPSDPTHALLGISFTTAGRGSGIEGGSYKSQAESLGTNYQAKIQHSETSSPLDLDTIATSSEDNTGGTVGEGVDVDMDLTEAGTFGMDLNPAIMASKLAASMDRQNRKVKRLKSSDSETKSETRNSPLEEFKCEKDLYNVSEEEKTNEKLIGGSLEQDKYFVPDTEIPCKTPPATRSSPSPVVGTSFKIAKSGDSLKISKTESKSKQKESRRSSSVGESPTVSSGKRKGDAKKERKKKRAESADSIDRKSPIKLTLETSLMPPPASLSSETSSVSVVSSANAETQPLRPITLNMKPLSLVSSSSSGTSKSTVVSSKKSSTSSGSGSGSNSPTPKSISSNKVSMLGEKGSSKSSPASQSQTSGNLRSNIDSEGSTKMIISTPSLKIQTKHKQGSSSKSNSSSSWGSGSVGVSALSSQVGGGPSSGGRSSPSKGNTPRTAILKLKNLNLPASTTITPVASKPSAGSTVGQSSIANSSVISCSVSIIPASTPSISTTVAKSQQSSSTTLSGSYKSTSSGIRSRKGSLSDVIDKLRVNASHAQQAATTVGKAESSSSKPDTTSERKESKPEKKDSGSVKESGKDREGSTSRSGESKPKYSSSDQFTVKPSAQGIKLTVTKTRSSDGSYKTSSKNKVQSGSKNMAVSSSSISNSNKPVSSSGNTVQKNVSPSSKKNTPSSSPNTSHKSATGGVTKSSSSSVQKGLFTSASSSTTSSSSKVSSTSNSSVKLSTKVSISSKDKNSSSSKMVEKVDKPKTSVPTSESKGSFSESKQEVKSSTTTSGSTNLMPPPQSSKPLSELRITGGNTPKRSEESPLRHSPRHTPTRDSADESESEKVFWLLLAQTKMDSQNSSIARASDAPENSKGVSPVRSVSDEKSYVTSSTDVKPSMSPVTPSDLVAITDKDILENQKKNEVSSSIRAEDAVTTTSSNVEESSKIPSAIPARSGKVKRKNSDSESSPEDGLVIDCPGIPRLQKSPEKKARISSPKSESMPPNTTITHESTEKTEPSPSRTIAKSPFQSTPIESPGIVRTPPSNQSVTSSMSRPSPCDIDDELMDEALIGLGK
ncbi:mediator of RNA polymerase II transcription subunit 1-like isoform X1 [Limulus polyphemus]|uniref:Mediator of RNA polymerase II transcription subunit 1 n=2 Tax=Limulus polyphemus TaxID=6850 RepID=A0ABM1S4L7_LIMPO|nr:mediator of RNA polymerase II transcription subunit 1-like isoform X1 [Limulus polyphemus]